MERSGVFFESDTSAIFAQLERNFPQLERNFPQPSAISKSVLFAFFSVRALFKQPSGNFSLHKFVYQLVLQEYIPNSKNNSNSRIEACFGVFPTVTGIPNPGLKPISVYSRQYTNNSKYWIEAPVGIFPTETRILFVGPVRQLQPELHIDPISSCLPNALHTPCARTLALKTRTGYHRLFFKNKPPPR